MLKRKTLRYGEVCYWDNSLSCQGYPKRYEHSRYLNTTLGLWIAPSYDNDSGWFSQPFAQKLRKIYQGLARQYDDVC